MPFAGEWCKVWIYFGFVFAWAKGARPRFDTSTDMGLVLVPADAEVDSVIFRLRATDQDADFPLVFEITATITPVVRIDNLPCTLYNKVCQANVILTKRLVPGRLHDFAVRVRDTKGDSNSMQATISVTNATTPRDKIFPHIPSLIMVPEDSKPGKEIDYLLVRANTWSGKPVYIELWQPKELFTIRQRQTPIQTRGVIILTGELDFETQSMYTLTMYATDPYTEPGKDTRNIAGLSVVVIVQDVQDVPPIFTLAPPLTRINNSVQPGDIILRVHAEDGDKGVPREIVYGLVSEGNPFTPFFNISETSGEITLAKPLDELTQITHVGAPVVLTVVAEELRRSREEPPAQATVVDVGFLLGEPGNSPPYFESDNYIATIDENPDPGTVINFGEPYSTRVKDEDIGKAGVFALKLENNNNTFEVNPTVAERTADFIITVRDNTLIDYELYKVLSFKIVAQEVGPATNLSASMPVTIYLRDINDNPPIFDEKSYEVTLSENVTAESRVIQVHASDKDTGVYGSIRYTGITGEGSEAFILDPDTGLITVAMGSSLDREVAAKLLLTVEARDEDGNGNKGVIPLIVNLLDVNDNAPIFERDVYEFTLNSDLTNFTSPAFIKAIDSDAEPPNNVVRYELIHGNYENKFYLNETSGEIILLSPITKIRRKKQSAYDKFSKKASTKFVNSQGDIQDDWLIVTNRVNKNESLANDQKRINLGNLTKEMMMEVIKKRRKRDNDNALYTLTARAYDLGVPHLSSETKIRIISGIVMEARIMMFVVPGEQPDSTKTAETLAAITGGRVTVLETRPYIQQNHTGGTGVLPTGGKKSIIVARVEQTEPGSSLVDVEKIRETLAANGVGIIGGTDAIMNTTHVDNTKPPTDVTPRHTNVNDGQTTIVNNTITTIQNEEVTVYKAENKLLFWLLIILGLLMLLAIAALIVCCICPGCPFYMAPRKRRVHSSETLVVRADGRPKRHLHRQPAVAAEVSWNGRKQAWSADPTRRNWQFNKRNVKNCSLPGDVAYISGQPNDLQMNIEAQRLRDGPTYGHSRRSRMNEQERIYMEDVEEQKVRGYRTAEMDSLQRHEMDRGSDLQHQAYRQRFMEPDMNEETTIREQHFYREGNAEVLRLVTRGQVEDTSHPHQLHHHRPTTLIVDGKDIILQRFIEDQKSRHELSMQDIEAARSMESHQRPKELCQQQQQPEIILIPDRLDLGHRQHVEEIGPTVQRLVIDHGDYGSPKIEKESLRQEKQDSLGASITDRPPVMVKDQVQPGNVQYGFHDMELARQNALLTRLLLEKENRRAGAGAVDSTSYLETQSLPGQVAIATQTDRTAATQTERQVKSRSDNDESDEESRYRKKLKSRKKYGDGDWKRSRTLWMKSPIEEEGSPCFDKRLSILRKKVREVKEGRKVSLEPEVLREISDSLDGNGSSYKGEEDETMRSYRKSTEQTSISYKILNEKEIASQSSEETRKDDHKTNVTESTSSPEMKIQREKHAHGKADERSPKREKSKAQQKSEGVIKPSFRILEKEFTMLTKKLSKLGDKKFREGSDGASQEKSESFGKETKKDLDQRSSKKVETSSSQKQTSESGQTSSKVDQRGKQRKESAIAKTKQKLKYQQTQVISTGSSEFDDALDKPKKLNVPRHDSVKQKQSLGAHAKLKRFSQMDRRESKKQTAECRDEEAEKRKDHVTRETQKAEAKSEKMGKVTKAPKIALQPRKQNVSEETSTSTEERKEERAMCTIRAFEKKSSTDFSGKESDGMQQLEGERFVKRVIQKFSDDFVEEPGKEDVQGKIAISVEKEENAGLEKEREIEEPKGVTGKKLGTVDSVPRPKNRLEASQDSLEKPGKSDEHVTPKKVMEDSKTPLHVTEQLITDFTVIHTSPAKRDEPSKMIARDRESDTAGSSQTESLAIKEPMEHKEESVNCGNGVDRTETAQADSSMSETWKGLAQHVKDKLERYVEKIKSVGDSEKEIQAMSQVESREQSQEDEEAADRGKELKEEIEEIPKDFEKYGVLEESEKVGKEDRVVEIFRGQKEMDVPAVYISTGRKLKQDTDEESDSKEETRGTLEVEVEVHTPMRDHDDKINGREENMEPVEKHVGQEIPGNHENDKSSKNSAGEKSIVEPNGDEEKGKVDETIREKEEEVERVDTLTAVSIVEDKKKDSAEIATNGHEKRKIDLDAMKIPSMEEVTSKVDTDVAKTEENSFLDEKMSDKEDIEQMKLHDQIEKDILTDKETKIKDEEEDTTKDSIKHYEIVEKAMEEWEIVKDKIEDQEIGKGKAIDDKIIGETIAEHQIYEDTITDRKSDNEVIEDDKIPEETIIEYKIPEEPTMDQEIAGEKIEDHPTVGETIMGDKIAEEKITGEKIAKEIKEDHKIIVEDTVVDEMIEKEPEDQQIGDEEIKDHETVEKSIMDQTVTETIENVEVDEERTKDHKITEEKSEDQKSDKEAIERDEITEKSSEITVHKIAEEANQGEKIDIETMQDHETDGEPIMDQTVPEDKTDKEKVDKETSKEYETDTKSNLEYGDTAEMIKDKNLDEGTIKDFKIVAEEVAHPKIQISEDTIVIEAEDYDKIVTKTDDVIAKEKISDEEKKTSTKIGDDKEESIFLEEGGFEGDTIATEIKTDDHEMSKEKVPLGEEVNIAAHDQNEEAQSITDKKEALAKVEETTEQALSNEHKIKEEGHNSSDSEKEVHPEKRDEAAEKIDKIDDCSMQEQEDIIEDKKKEIYRDEEIGTQETGDPQIKEEITEEVAKEAIEDREITDKIITESDKIDQQGSKEAAEEVQPTDDYEIMEKEITETRDVTEKKHVPETSTTEQELTIRAKYDISQMEKHPEDKDASTEIPDVPEDGKVVKEKDESLKISPTEEDVEEPDVTTEIPIPTSEDIKQDTPMEPAKPDDHVSKKESVFSEVFKAVHSLVDKLTNSKESSAKESPITGQSHPEAKILHKEIPSLPSDDKDNNETEMSSTRAASISQTNGSTSSGSQKVEADMIEDETLDQRNVEEATVQQEATEKPSETDTSREPKETEPVKDDKELDRPSRDETTQLASGSSIETSAIVESSEPLLEPKSPTKARDEEKEETEDGEDVSGELFEGTAEASMEAERVRDNETVDGELARTIEKEEQLHEPSSKASASFQRIESPGSCPQTYGPTEKEKFAFDCIISGTRADSTKISEFEKQSESESEQTVLPEVEQMAEEETSSAMGDEIRMAPTFPLDQSKVEPEAPANVPREEPEKHAATEEMDRAWPLVEVVAREEMIEAPVGEGYVDVSLPLFTSMIDTADDSEDSDSSSDISRKTTLTTRPYQTPRHRARQLSEKETSQAKETTEALDIEDGEKATLTIELIEDDNVESSKEEKVSGIEQSSPTELIETEEEKEAVSSQETMNVPSHRDMENRQAAKRVESKQSSEESSTKHAEDAKVDPRKKDQGKTSGAQNVPSVSKLAKTETFKVADRRTKELERKRMPIQRKKKSSSEESSEEKATHIVHRAGKKPLEDQPKQKDSDQARQSRRRDEESRRKQSMSKSKAEKDKKSSSSGEKYPTPPKTGEIDTSKTQPKYMAWYTKNREEMERKRAELMATDDEEQLPKWLRRSMRSQKSEKEEKRQTSEKAAELTPRTRRKVKPLVNVESEQLKAIVRQGRKLRRAEGGKNEDPPIQIFAATPPSVPQTDSKHHLVQHSEYKYEKIPAPFYLHPPPVPHPSPQLSPEHFNMPPTIERERTDEDFDPGVPMSVQSGNRLRHQQLLEKKSVFDIAYSEAAPSQLRSDSTTPPS